MPTTSSSHTNPEYIMGNTNGNHQYKILARNPGNPWTLLHTFTSNQVTRDSGRNSGDVGIPGTKNMGYVSWSNNDYYYEWMIRHTDPGNRYIVSSDSAPGPELYMGGTASFAEIEWGY